MKYSKYDSIDEFFSEIEQEDIGIYENVSLGKRPFERSS